MSSHVIRARPPRGVASHLEPDRDPDRLRSYLEDAAHVPGGHAAGIIFPRSEADVAAVLGAGHPVLPIGVQSSLTGGATPMGELLLSTARLDDIDAARDRAIVGPGVTLADLDAALRPLDAWYPPVPTFTGATVGGVVSTNAAGAATFKYGTTRPWVQALTVVLATGDVLDLRRGSVHAHPDGYFEIELRTGTVRVQVPDYRLPCVPKVSAGYYAAPGMDLIDLFIGAEGTLGIITSVTVKTASPRPAIALALVSCTARRTGLRLASALRNAPGVAAIEHLDRKSLELLREDHTDVDYHVTLPLDTDLVLIVTLELAERDNRRSFEEIAEALDSTVAGTPLVELCRILSREHLLDRTEIALPEDETRQAEFIALREAVPAAVNRRIARAQQTVDPRIAKVAADVIVPYDRLADLLELCQAEFDHRGLTGAVWGHISDGNLHPNVVPRSFEDYVAGTQAALTIGRAAIDWGGSPCAEHGVGRHAVKLQLVRDLYGDRGVAAMRRIKDALDPQRRLAPGVLGL